jgi:cobalamin biosynthesis protein CobT
MSVFGLFESTSFAKAIAKSNGIKIQETRERVIPSIVSRDTLRIGPESIYGHEVYMEELHSELSKLFPELSFFHDLDMGKGTEGDTIKQILLQHRAEWQKNGEYKGRDRILQDRYVRKVREQGGLTQLASTVATMNEDVAALLCADAEMRGEWQGVIPGETPSRLRPKVDAMKPLFERLYSVENEEQLSELIKEICNAEPVPPGSTGDQQDPSSKADGKEQGKRGASKDGSDPGESSEAGAAEKRRDGEGSESVSGDNSGDGADDSDASSEGQDSSGSTSEGQADGGGSQEDGGNDSGSPGEAGSGKEKGQASSGSGEEASSSSPPSPSVEKNNWVGAQSNSDGGTGQLLSKMSLVRNAADFKEKRSFSGDPYVPVNKSYDTDITRQKISAGRVRSYILQLIANSSLSKQVRKYLITVKQTGYTYGLKRGKISNRSIARIYTGEAQPRIFKERNSCRLQTDTAIFILGDCSGSMSGSKYVKSSSCQILISETLRDLQVPHMCAQFTTGDTAPIHYIMKHFDETNVSRDTLLDRYSSDQIRMNCNADGESVIWAATHLAKRPEKNKLLIVLSDGAPAFGHGDDSRFLRDVVKEIDDSRHMNIIGIGIQDVDVRNYYPKYRIVHKVEDLERVLFELLKETLLGGAK